MESVCASAIDAIGTLPLEDSLTSLPAGGKFAMEVPLAQQACAS